MTAAKQNLGSEEAARLLWRASVEQRSSGDIYLEGMWWRESTGWSRMWLAQTVFNSNRFSVTGETKFDHGRLIPSSMARRRGHS